MTENDIAYFAGLFDGEGSVYFKKTKQVKHKRPGKPIHNVTVIRMEIAMTDKDTIKWCHDLFKCGHFGERKVKEGYKRQWRWRVAHRDALEVAIAIWPHVKTKLHKIEQIIDYYEDYDGKPKNVVDLEEYKLIRKFRRQVHGT